MKYFIFLTKSKVKKKHEKRIFRVPFVCVVSVGFVCFVFDFSRHYQMHGNEHKPNGANVTDRTARKPLYV